MSLSRRRFLGGGLLALGGVLRAPRLALAGVAHRDRPLVHGMVVLGVKRVYLSHPPLFRSPHDYQGILSGPRRLEGAAV